MWQCAPVIHQGPTVWQVLQTSEQDRTKQGTCPHSALLEGVSLCRGEMKQKSNQEAQAGAAWLRMSWQGPLSKELELRLSWKGKQQLDGTTGPGRETLGRKSIPTGQTACWSLGALSVPRG